jgi:hypothetical protein
MLGKDQMAWLRFFNGLNCPLVSEDEDHNICIGEKYKFAYTGKGRYQEQMTFWLNLNDPESYQDIVFFRISDSYNILSTCVTVLYSSSFIWITIDSLPSTTTATSYRALMFHESLGDKQLYGSNLGYNWHEITTSFTEINTNSNQCMDIVSGNPFLHIAQLGFPAQTGDIIYTASGLFQGNSSAGYTKVMVDPNFLSCTSIERDNIVVFDMHEFYALTSNILVPIGSELEVNNSNTEGS